MAYKLRCRKCNHTYIAAREYYACPRSYCEANRPTLIGEVLETAADVATAYFMVDVAVDVLDGVGSLIGGLFD